MSLGFKQYSEQKGTRDTNRACWDMWGGGGGAGCSALQDYRAGNEHQQREKNECAAGHGGPEEETIELHVESLRLGRVQGHRDNRGPCRGSANRGGNKEELIIMTHINR